MLEKKKILLNKFRDDAFLFVCNFKIYENILIDINKGNFIFDKRNNNNKVTLSVGIAFNSDDIIQLYTLANEAVICASERGGNQIAIHEYGSKIVFFGGDNYIEKENNNFRNYFEILLSEVKMADNIFITGHAQGDMDSLASCLGMYEFCKSLNKKCFIVCDIETLETKAKAALKKMFLQSIDIFLKPEQITSPCNEKDLLIVVDHNSLFISEIRDVYEKIFLNCRTIIIDHHRRQEKIFNNKMHFIDVSASSTSEIIAKVINMSNVKLSQNTSTLLLSGILFDSLYFRSYRTNASTFRAAYFLTSQNFSDKTLAYDLLKDSLEEKKQIMYECYNRLIKIDDEIFCCVVDRVCQKSFLAKLANFMIEIKNVKIAFAIGKLNDNIVYASCRGSGTNNVQVIAEKMKGGGHYDAAAFMCDKKSVYEVLEELCFTLTYDFKKNILICPICFSKIEKKEYKDYNKNCFFVCSNHDCSYVTYCDDKNSNNKKYTTFKNLNEDVYFLNNNKLYEYINKYKYLEKK